MVVKMVGALYKVAMDRGKLCMRSWGASARICVKMSCLNIEGILK